MDIERKLTPLEEEVFNIFEKHNLTSGFNPTTCSNELIEWFDVRCQLNQELDPYERDKAEIANNLCGWVSQLFEGNDYPSACVRVLIYLWNKFSEYQRTQSGTGIQIYKAGIAYFLFAFYWRSRDRDIGASVRWALLCHVDDMLASEEGHKGSGSHRLLNTLGMTQDAYDAINQIAQDNRTKGEGKWNHRSHFAENVLVEFILTYPEYAFWLTQPTSVIEFPVSTAYFKVLQNDLKNTTDGRKKGARFEDLATYLMLLIPSWLPQRNISPPEKSFEHDIVVNNMMSSDNLEVDVYGRAFLAECKYLKDAVEASDVGYFLHRMHLTHTHFGIIFAKRGITGKTKDKYAQNQISRAYQQDKRICIVIEENDLNELETGNFSFRAMLLKKVNEVRFGKPQSRNGKAEDNG
jgi:hypothetical protein